MATLTNAIIFVPVAFIESGDSFTDLLKAFQMPILCSLGSSLVVALFFIPILSVAFKNQIGVQEQTASPAASEKVIQAFRKIQSHKQPIAAAVLTIVGLATYFILGINQTDLESPRDAFTSLNVKFTPEVPFEDRMKIFLEAERILLEHKAEIGYNFMVSDFNSHFLTGTFCIYPPSKQDPDSFIDLQEKRINLVLKKFPKYAGFSAQIGYAGGAQAKQRRSQIFYITGPKTTKLMTLEEDLKEKFEKVRGIESVKLDREESGNRDLIFIPHESLIAQFGMSLKEIAGDISSTMGSIAVSNLNLNGQIVAAKISLEPTNGEWTIDNFKNLKITNHDHKSVRINDLGKIVPMSFIRSVSRVSGIAKTKLITYFSENLSEQNYRNSGAELRRIYNQFSFPKGYGPPLDESRKHIQEMQEKSNFIILLSALLIYLLLASMFESFLIPFAILFTVPLAIIFGCAGLWALGMDLDVMARLSLVILVGIGVNGAIILIDLILHLKKLGYKREEAVVIGCARRLKAVLMSASIQMISVLPVALGQSKLMGIPYASLGVSIISGMLFSTLITLIILPMAYEFLDELESKIKNILVGQAP